MLLREGIHAVMLCSVMSAMSAGVAAAQDDGAGTTTTTATSTTTGTGTTGAADTGDTGWAEPAAPGSSERTGLLARPFYVGGGVGFDAGLNAGGGVLFAAEEDVGFRFFGFHLGDARDGAIFAGLSFGQAGGNNFIGLQFDVRGGVDLEVWDGGDMQLLVTPSITLGGGVFIVSVPDPFGGGTTTATNGAFDFGFSAQGELVMLEGLLGVWLRPLSFELYINSGVGALYELLGGVTIRL